METDKSKLWRTIDGEYVAMSDVSDEHLRGIWALCRRKLRDSTTKKTLVRYLEQSLKQAELEMEKRADVAAKAFYTARTKKWKSIRDALDQSWEKGGFDDEFFDEQEF